MWAFVNGQSLDATMGVGDGASHSSLALSGNTSSVTLVLKSFCTAFSFPTAVLGGDPVPQPMVGATFDVCGTPIPTDDTWVCINHFPEEGSWSSPSFDDSAWPPAVTVEGHGLPPNLTYIAGSPESSDGGDGGGWETFCRKTVPLPGSGDAAAPPAPPAPIVPATPALPLSPPVWITRVVVEGNCSLVNADLHDLSVNFGFLVGLKEELGFPPCNCTLLGHHPAPALAKPTDSAWPCAHVNDPCLFNYSFSGPQDWLTEEMLEEAIHDPTFSTIFDTRNSSSSEFCEVQKIITDLPPLLHETGEEPPLITDGPLPLRPNTSIPAIPPTPAVPGDGSNDSSVSVPAPPAPISPPDALTPAGDSPGDSSVTGPSSPAPAAPVSPPSLPDAPTPAGDSPADSSVSGPSPPAPAAPVSPPSGSGSNDSSVSVPGRPVDGVPSTTTDTPAIGPPTVPAGDSPADSSVSGPGRPVPSTTEPAVDMPVTPPTQIPIVPPVTSVDSPTDPASPPTAPVAPPQGAGGEDDAIPPPTIAQPALPSGGAPEVPAGGEDEVPPPAIIRPPSPPATDDTIDSSVPGPVRPLPPTTPTTPTEPAVDTPETPALAPPAETPAVPAVPAVDSPAEPVSPPDAPALPGDGPVDDVPVIPPQAAGGEDEAIPPPLTNDEPALPTTDDTNDSSISPPTRPTEPVPSTGDSPPIAPPTDIPAAPTPPSETVNPQEPNLPTVPETTGGSDGGNDSSVSIPPTPPGEVQPSVQPGDAIGPPATPGNDSSVSIPPAPTGEGQPSVQPSDSVAPPSIPEAGEDSSVSIPPQASNSGTEEAPQPQPAASNDPGVEPTPEPLANGGDDSLVAPPQASNSGSEEAPQPQPAASEDSGAPAMPEPQPAASNDDGGAIAVEPSVTNEEPLEFPAGPATVVACGETVTFELASEGPGALFQVEAMGDGDVTVRATTCVEGTQVDTIVSLYDSNPSEGAAPVASNDNDASCARDPTFSTVSTVIPDGSTIYMHVVNKGVEAGGASLKVHCGVYD